MDDEGCRTPDRGVGTCLPINSCQPILDVFMESPRPMPDRLVEYLRSFQCGVFNGQAKVCCPDGPIVNALVSGYPDVSGHRNLGLLPRDVCGQDIDEDKIIGGNKTGVFEFPWMALISYRTGGAVDGDGCFGVVARVGDREVVVSSVLRGVSNEAKGDYVFV